MSRGDVWCNKRVLVTGSAGFVGSNLVPLLRGTGCLLLTPSRHEYDLLNQGQVRRMFADAQPHVVFHLAGLVGGILATKKRPAEYFYENLIMGTTVLHEAWRSGVEKYVTLVGACSYPASAPSPIAETELWNGYPQIESASYSMAKAMSVVQVDAYRQQYDFNAIALVPGNLYGPHDNFDLQHAHVIPSLVRKFHEAKISGAEEVVAWGTGRPIRDFVYIEDACDAILHAAEQYDGGDIINISSGRSTTIRELVETISTLIGYEGRIIWDASKPDGQMFKALDVTRMHEWLGYDCTTTLAEGLTRTLRWFAANYGTARLEVSA